MSTSPDSELAKCSCQHCGIHLEFPLELAGATIECPDCTRPTALIQLIAEPEAHSRGSLTQGDVTSAFEGAVPKTRASLFYTLGLMIVTVAMVLLPLVYLALIAVTGWAVYFWATEFSTLVSMTTGGGRAYMVRFVLYLTPLFAGVVLLLFLVKPLFARRPKAAQPLALNPGAEPILFAFVSRICEVVGAPQPSRIDLDCHLNASASFRRGAWSLLGNDLVLTIGLPLVAGLSARQFAGVLAHEFGHFTQGFGMRLTYIIRSVNLWFARVAYERDSWDETLEEWGEAEGGWISFIVGCARLAVWCSRQILKLLMFAGHGIG